MKRRTAFTLIELLCVLVILSLLTAIVFVATINSKGKSRETVCMSNLKQIGLAIRMYQSDYDELPLKIKDIHPAYLENKQVFRCPNWDALASTKSTEMQEEIAAMLTLYSYQPAERAFWASVPYEPGDPPSLSSGWEEGYQKRGEMTPLVTCQFHDPYASQGGNSLGNGWIEVTRMVLRLDGSVTKVTKRYHRRSSWYDY